MNKYGVAFYYTEWGTTEVEANTPEEARAKVFKHMELVGLPTPFEVAHREYDTVSVEDENGVTTV